MTGRRHLYVSLECLGICILEVFKLRRPCKRTNNVCVDTVLSPFCSRYPGETADTLFSCCIRALTVVTKKTCAGSKVDDCSLSFFKVWIASLHIVEGCIKSGVHCKIELFGCMILNCYAGGRSLCVVDKNVDSAECLNCLFNYHIRCCFVV